MKPCIAAPPFLPHFFLIPTLLNLDLSKKQYPSNLSEIKNHLKIFFYIPMTGLTTAMLIQYVWGGAQDLLTSSKAMWMLMMDDESNISGVLQAGALAIKFIPRLLVFCCCLLFFNSSCIYLK